MRRPLALVAAASLTAGAFAFVGYDSAVLRADVYAKGGVSVGANKTNTLPDGVTLIQQGDTQGIRTTLSDCIDSCISQGDSLGKLSWYLSSSDRSRLNDLSTMSDKQLDKQIALFQQNWKQKYGTDFFVQPMAFGDQYQGFIIVQGEVTNPALMSNWPVEPTQTTTYEKKTTTHYDSNAKGDPKNAGRDSSGLHAGVGGPGSPPFDVVPGTGSSNTSGAVTSRDELGGRTGISTETSTRTDVTGTTVRRLDKGMNVAVVTLPAERNAPELNISLVRENRMGAEVRGDVNRSGAEAGANIGASSWKLDIPDTVSSNQLKDSLRDHLMYLNNNKDQWPADQIQAERFVSHHILMALYDVSGGESSR